MSEKIENGRLVWTGEQNPGTITFPNSGTTEPQYNLSILVEDTIRLAKETIRQSKGIGDKIDEGLLLHDIARAKTIMKVVNRYKDAARALWNADENIAATRRLELGPEAETQFWIDRDEAKKELALTVKYMEGYAEQYPQAYRHKQYMPGITYNLYR